MLTCNKTCLHSALSCPLLEAPMNGSIDCNTQTVGGTCNYSCDPTYTLRGSVSRNCLPILVWTGRPAICDPPLCPELTPPDNGFVLFPCTRREMDTCDVICTPGYTLSGNTEQTCELNSTADILMWSMPPTCEGTCMVSLVCCHVFYIVAQYLVLLTSLVLNI